MEPITGNAAPQEVLLARWAEILNDPSLRNLPYKIELNELQSQAAVRKNFAELSGLVQQSVVSE